MFRLSYLFRNSILFITFLLSLIYVNEKEPLRLYVVADVHVGNCDKGEDLTLFAHFVNKKKPDLVLDLGDVIKGRSSDLYNYRNDRLAAIEQKKDWLAAWNKINIKKKEVALGNRDVQKFTFAEDGIIQTLKDPIRLIVQNFFSIERYPLTERHWLNALGYQNRPTLGGTKLQTSFKVESQTVSAKVFVISEYSNIRTRTLDWIEQEIRLFDGDFIIFASHSHHIYDDLRDLVLSNNIQATLLYLHGHNHGPDTVVRDAWGLESLNFYFPSYLITEFTCTGVGTKFKLYPDGTFDKFRLDARNQTISDTEKHFRTRAEYPLPPPLLEGPKNMRSENNILTFTWAPVMFADSYRIQVSGYENFETVIIDKKNIIKPDIEINLAEVTHSTFYWRVRGENSRGNGEWSDTMPFSLNLNE